MCLQMFCEDSNWNGWIDRQWQAVPERQGTRAKSSCACVDLDPRDWQANSFALSQWMGWEWWGEHGLKINRLFFMKVNKLILNNILTFTGNQWRERSSGTLRVKGGDFVTTWASQFWTCWSLVSSVPDTIQKWIAIIRMNRHKGSCM